MKKLAKALLLLLTLTAILFAVPMASAADITASGTCGESLTWVLTEDGTLTISGSGAMTDYSGTNVYAPWYAYRSKLTAVSLPDGITTIGNSAFYNCVGLAEVTIPKGVTAINDYAFYGCSKLTDISIPEGVTTIGSYAFRECTALASVTLPDGLTDIGSYAFYKCTELSALVLPDSMKTIGSSALNTQVCLFFDGTQEQWSAVEAASSCPVFFWTEMSGTCGDKVHWTFDAKTQTLTISGTGAMANYNESDANLRTPWHDFKGAVQTVSVETGVTAIGNYAFHKCTALSEVSLPEGVTAIGSHVFYDCDRLTEVTLPKGLTSLGNYAFYWCTGLTEVSIPMGTATIGNAVFQGCSGLTAVTFAQGLTAIGTDVFYNCANLTAVELPEGLTAIGSRAFQNCTGLTEVSIPGSLKTIGLGSFTGCSSLRDVYFNGTEADWAKISIGRNNEPLHSAKLHASVRKPSIASLLVLDSNGRELDAIPTGDFRAEAVLSNPSGIVLLAAYTADGQLVSAVCSTSARFTNNGNIAEVRAFLLTSLGNPAPLCEAVRAH